MNGASLIQTLILLIVGYTSLTRFGSLLDMNARRSYAQIARGEPVQVTARKTVRSLGLEFAHIPVRGDGNCFFRSISVWLYGSENGYERVRRDIIQYVQNRKASSWNYA